MVCGIKSTGRICTDLAEALDARGHTVKIAYGRDNVPEKYQRFAHRVGNDVSVKTSAVQARLLDNTGFANKAATREFVEWIKDFDPDTINLHVIHGYWLNIEILFQYLRESGKKIIWTLHDCWAFTGHCVHFEYARCYKWKECCGRCPEKKEYPTSMLLDSSEKNYKRKKAAFTGIRQMRIVTPSEWLAKLVQESFLKEYPVSVITNGIDTSVFRPTESRLREKYGLEQKKVVLGVSSSWRERKGLNAFEKLAEELGDDYQVLLIGLSKSQIEKLPGTIIGIERTDSVQDLAAYYTMADVYVNASYEENYPTTNLEAIACGTPVVSFDAGGSGESARFFGTVVPRGDIAALAEEIRHSDRFLSEDADVSYERMIEQYLFLFSE